MERPNLFDTSQKKQRIDFAQNMLDLSPQRKLSRENFKLSSSEERGSLKKVILLDQRDNLAHGPFSSSLYRSKFVDVPLLGS